MSEDTLDLFAASTPAEPVRSRASLPDAIARSTVPSQRKSITSTVAGRRLVETGAHETQLDRVYAYITSCGVAGATRSEIADRLQMRLSAVCGRVNTLYRQGLIGSNRDHVRRYGDSRALQEVLLNEVHVTRWWGTRRRGRTMLDGRPCDLAKDGDE